jgi:hypothetical protein
MKTAIACLVALIILQGFALANPIAIDLYGTFDPNGYEHEYSYPVAGQPLTVYIAAETWQVGGLTLASFDLSIVPSEAAYIVGFTSYSPIVTIDGGVDTGYTVHMSECVEDSPFVMGYAQILYMSPCQMEILPHPVNGNLLVDCSVPPEEAEYCYVQGVGLGMAQPSPSDLCGNPAEERTWGAMKALYR